MQMHLMHVKSAINTWDESFVFSIDFRIICAEKSFGIDISAAESQMKAAVELYRPPGTFYSINAVCECGMRMSSCDCAIFDTK